MRLWLGAVSATLLSLSKAAQRPLFNQATTCGLQQPFQYASNLSTGSSSLANMTRGAVIAISHGGGPMPVIGDPSHKEIIRSLKERVPKVLRLNTPESPRAIIVVTAHWSERNPTISNAKKHELYYDYGGFPPETYSLKYNAPGNPEVAQELFDALKGEGLQPEMDDERGWDHGVFVPLMLIRPAADIPVVQLSVLASEDPEQHFKMGLALQTLRESNVAVIGSGFASFHNLRLMFSGITYDPDFRKRNMDWNEAVRVAVTEKASESRLEKLKGWRKFPGGYEMHPRGGGEHLMPLLVCAGAGGDKQAQSYTDEFMGLDMYSFYWD